MIYIFTAILNIPGLFEDFKKNFKTALPIVLNYDHHDPLVQNWITKKIKQFYFDNDLTKDKQQNITNVSRTGHIFCSADKPRLKVVPN